MPPRLEPSEPFNASCVNCERERSTHRGRELRCPDGTGRRYSRPGPDGAPTRKVMSPSRHSTSFSHEELKWAATVLPKLRTNRELAVLARAPAAASFERKIANGLQQIESRVGGGAASTSNGGDHGE